MKSKLFLWSFCVAVILPISLQAQTAPSATPSSPPQPNAQRPYVPVTPHERWELYYRQNFYSASAILRTFGTAVIDQLNHDPPEWGQGAKGYFSRVGSDFGYFTIQGTVQAGLSAALREDPGYHLCECRSTPRRAWHAIARTFVTYTSTGKTTVDVAGLAGIYAGPIVSIKAWYPARYDPLKDGFREGNISLGIQAGLNLFKEFGPDLKHTFLRRGTKP